jgi:hypothetical protein
VKRTYYRFLARKRIELGAFSLVLFQSGPDYYPIARYVALEYNRGAGQSIGGWTMLVRYKRIRPDTRDYFAPLVVWPKREWKGLQKAIWSGYYGRPEYHLPERGE